MFSFSFEELVKMANNDNTGCDAFSEFVVGDGSVMSAPISVPLTSRREAIHGKFKLVELILNYI